VYLSAHTLPHPLLSNFLVDQTGSASFSLFPLLTLFGHVVNFDLVIFENDNFSTKANLFWCARVHQTTYVSVKKD
jgi:hypothetical protein